jgi:nitrogen fixation protein FixH
MNWGNRLLLVFIGFAGLIGYMVYRCVETPVDLVTKEYYRDELVFQDVIDGTKNANALSSKVNLKIQPGKILVQFPSEMKNAAIKGTLLFYCPSDPAKDKTVPLQVNADGLQILDQHGFIRGSYIVKINWKTDTLSYYTEETFSIL